MNLSHFPRRRYISGATALEPLDRLSADLGGPRIWLKRDDVMGLGGGGNKVRKLEFLLADALNRGADTIITTGAVQSNHCRLTVAAASREGLSTQLVLEERIEGSYDPLSSGNNFLFDLFGAETVHVVPGGSDVQAAMMDLAEELRASGRTPYIVPGGGSNALGALGYVSCAIELIAQELAAGLRIDAVVCASGSGGTHAGLLAGVLATHSQIPIVGISVRHPAEVQKQRIRGLVEDIFATLHVDLPVGEADVQVEDGYVGEGYSLPTAGMVEALRTLARGEGILLDPVYTGKAMDGLIDLVRRGRFESDQNVVFIHTGGAPSLSAFESAFRDPLSPSRS